jgi:hypothetical protein
VKHHQRSGEGAPIRRCRSGRGREPPAKRIRRSLGALDTRLLEPTARQRPGTAADRGRGRCYIPLMSPARVALVIAALAAVSGCHSRPPPSWAQGGSPTALGRARWERGSDTVDLFPDGRVVVDGDTLWVIDPAGRVTDADRDPVGVVFSDGRFLGTDDAGLGIVGTASASPPGSGTAWLSVAPTGEVILYDSEGGRSPGGGWSGCQGPLARTCTLVTHLVVFRDFQRRSRVGVGFGFGVGIRR